MIVLDTSVLVYAVGADHPLRDPCRTIIEDIGAGRTAATTTVEVIQEFVHVRARRRGRDDAHDVGQQYIDLLSPLISPDAADLQRGLALFRAIGDLGAFDAVLAAVVLQRDHLTALASADRAFDAVTGLHVVDPSASTR